MKKLFALPLMFSLLTFVACENDSVKRTETKVIDASGKETIQTKEVKDDAARNANERIEKSAKSAQDAVNSAQNAAQSARDAAKSAQDALRGN